MELSDFFISHPAVALAFSGGVDSAYLLWSAVRAGVDMTAYYVKSEFQPQFELDDARRLAGQLGARLRVLTLSALAVPKVAENPPNRCYFCKKAILGAIAARAKADGYPLLLDGTNASDGAADRPGMRALTELAVCSPLRLCGLSKDEIRRRSHAAGLFTWDKPAYACLATRIPGGTAITAAALEKIEKAESFLAALGLRDFRVRLTAEGARLEVATAQMPLILQERDAILQGLTADFGCVCLDLKGRS